jgi:hypothetical protein
MKLKPDPEQDDKVSNEKKNLSRISGELLVASRLTQRGYMIALQWGSTIGYDILAFDKEGGVAYIEVKSSSSYSRRWMLQKKYANPEQEKIPISKCFVCCVDLSSKAKEPDVYVFPMQRVADGLHYFFSSKFPNSSSYHLSLDFKPQGTKKLASGKENILTVGQMIDSETFLENYGVLKLKVIGR